MGGIWSIPCIVAGSSDIVVPIHQVPLSQDCRHDVFEEQPAANTEKDEPECCHCFRAPRFSLHDARALELFYILTILILLFLGCMGLPNFIPIWTSGRCNIQYTISVGHYSFEKCDFELNPVCFCHHCSLHGIAGASDITSTSIQIEYTGSILSGLGPEMEFFCVPFERHYSEETNRSKRRRSKLFNFRS